VAESLCVRGTVVLALKARQPTIVRPSSDTPVQIEAVIPAGIDTPYIAR